MVVERPTNIQTYIHTLFGNFKKPGTRSQPARKSGLKIEGHYYHVDGTI